MKVIKATKDAINRAVDLAFSLQGSVETRCRPLLVDATRKEIYELFLRYIEREEQDLLLIEKDGKLMGLPLFIGWQKICMFHFLKAHMDMTTKLLQMPCTSM